MTRKEEILNYVNSFKGKGMENEELKEIIRLAIIDGAMWADQTFIEKACQWFRSIDDGEIFYNTTEDFINAFHKVMGE